MTRAYYNEFDPKAANTLRELIANRLIAPGDVDERSITEVKPHELRGYTQCHFFAGAGIWSYAFRGGGIPDNRPAGSGSCPCQPFSAAGKGLGFADPRHLWPDWRALIAGCRAEGQPWTGLIFGEQAPTAGAWLDLVSADLEALGYAFGAVDVPAAGFGGFHIRQRFYWVADANHPERWADLAPGHDGDWPSTGRIQSHSEPRASGDAGGLGDAGGPGGRRDARTVSGAQASGGREGCKPRHFPDQLVATGDTGGLALTEHGGCEGWGSPRARLTGAALPSGEVDWLPCRDGKWRPVESGTFPLAHADPERVGRLRLYGNALDAETAMNVVAAYVEAEMLS